MSLGKASPAAPIIGGDLSLGVAVLDDFVSEIELAELRKKAELYRDTGVLLPNQAGPFRYSRRFDDTEFCDATMTVVGQRVIETFGLEAFKIDPYLGWIISYIEPGGFVHVHFDNQPLYRETDQQHFRCNVMVSNGGAPAGPVIDGFHYRVEERGLWGFFASDSVHSTEPNAGTGPRIVYQFGFTVPGDYCLPEPG